MSDTLSGISNTTARTTEPVTVSVIGCGYLGAVHAAAMAELGHRVIGVESDPFRAKTLSIGEAPFYEPGLEVMLTRNLEEERLTFTETITDAAEATIHFICVGTPQTHGGRAADLTYVQEAFEDLLRIVKPGDVVVGKSTVPVGTARLLSARLLEECPGASLVWNPEFLREGFAVEDTLRPDRVVIGCGPSEQEQRGGELLAAMYAPILEDTPLIRTDFATAELVKVSANAFLATKISFINAMADICELAGGDVTELADALGHDARIGRRFLNAGLGFGGGCLPKDIRAFMHRSAELGAEEALSFLREIDIINLRRRQKVVDLIRDWLGGEVRGRRIAVLGAAFKPNSDDIRDSPALAVADSLHVMGAHVRVTDPRAVPSARRISPALTYVDSAAEAVAGADVVLLLTEWEDYTSIDPTSLGDAVAERRILDARNALDGRAWRAAGWEYRALGRGGSLD